MEGDKVISSPLMSKLVVFMLEAWGGSICFKIRDFQHDLLCTQRCNAARPKICTLGKNYLLKFISKRDQQHTSIQSISWLQYLKKGLCVTSPPPPCLCKENMHIICEARNSGDRGNKSRTTKTMAYLQTKALWNKDYCCYLKCYLSWPCFP